MKALNVTCTYCGKVAKFVKGNEIYPHRADLENLNFYLCKPCDAYVGCHKKSNKFSYKGNEPKGTLANKKLRKSRSLAHNHFDQLWKNSFFLTRNEAYKWLAKEMSLTPSECHIGLFNEMQCDQVIAISLAKVHGYV